MSDSKATEILPNLWLGDKYSVQDESFVSDKHIQLLINCTSTAEFPNNPIFEKKYQLPSSINKSQLLPLLEQYGQIINTYINLYNILVYCDTGNHLSVIVIVYYIRSKTGLPVNTIVKLLKTKRPTISDKVDKI